MAKWICNACNFSDYTDSVSEQDLHTWLQCSNCGGDEFHLSKEVFFTISANTLKPGDEIHITTKPKNKRNKYD